MPKWLRVVVLLLAAGGVGAAIWTSPPMPEPPGVNAVSDARAMYGVPHAYDVVSSALVLLAGLVGLAFLGRGPRPSVDPVVRRGAHTAFASYRERPAYVLFFASMVLSAIGSAWYHLAPSTARLLWVRLPAAMTLGALVAIVLAERVDVYWSRVLLLPLFFGSIAAAVAWRVSEDAGRGDLRPFVTVQAIAFVVTTLALLFFRSRYTRAWELAVVVLFLVASEALARFDARVWLELDKRASGHTLAHVAAAVAAFAAFDMLLRRTPVAEASGRLSDA